MDGYGTKVELGQEPTRAIPPPESWGWGGHRDEDPSVTVARINAAVQMLTCGCVDPEVVASATVYLLGQFRVGRKTEAIEELGGGKPESAEVDVPSLKERLKQVADWKYQALHDPRTRAEMEQAKVQPGAYRASMQNHWGPEWEGVERVNADQVADTLKTSMDQGENIRQMQERVAKLWTDVTPGGDKTVRAEIQCQGTLHKGGLAGGETNEIGIPRLVKAEGQ